MGWGAETSLLLGCWAPVRSRWHTAAGWLRGVAACKPGTTCSALPTRRVRPARTRTCCLEGWVEVDQHSAHPRRSVLQDHPLGAIGRPHPHSVPALRRQQGQGVGGWDECSGCLHQQRQERTVSSQGERSKCLHAAAVACYVKHHHSPPLPARPAAAGRAPLHPPAAAALGRRGAAPAAR